MTIARKYTDNLRYFRRSLQGRGVNIRMTIVDPQSPYAPYEAGNRIAVPGLHSDDRIIAVLDLVGLMDNTGDLATGDATASHEYQSSDARFNVAALKAGTEGNNIYVQVDRKRDQKEAVLVSQPLSVDFGPYDVVLQRNGVDVDSTGHSKKSMILVMLATDSTGTADTVDPNGPNSAKNVRAAILDAQEALVGDASVDVTFKNGNGEDPVVAAGAVALSGGTDFDMGPLAASLTTDLDYTSPYFEQEVKYVARQRGASGNDITIAYTSGAPADGHKPTIGVTDDAIVVTYLIGTTTAADVIAAVNGNAAASLLVLASKAPGAVDDSGLISTLAATNLTGGVDPGIKLDVKEPGKLLIAWVTRDEQDEATI